MPLSIDEFEFILDKNGNFLKKRHEKPMMLQERFSKYLNMKTETLGINLPKPSADSVILKVKEFFYDPEADPTFANWSEKCGDIFRNYLDCIPDDITFKLLLRKLEPVENEKCPRIISNLQFD